MVVTFVKAKLGAQRTGVFVRRKDPPKEPEGVRYPREWRQFRSLKLYSEVPGCLRMLDLRVMVHDSWLIQ